MQLSSPFFWPPHTSGVSLRQKRSRLPCFTRFFFFTLIRKENKKNAGSLCKQKQRPLEKRVSSSSEDFPDETIYLKRNEEEEREGKNIEKS